MGDEKTRSAKAAAATAADLFAERVVGDRRFPDPSGCGLLAGLDVAERDFFVIRLVQV
jgi:hypothetical protein